MIINIQKQNYAVPACRIICIQCKAVILDASFRTSVVNSAQEEDWGEF